MTKDRRIAIGRRLSEFMEEMIHEFSGDVHAMAFLALGDDGEILVERGACSRHRKDDGKVIVYMMAKAFDVTLKEYQGDDAGVTTIVPEKIVKPGKRDA